MVTDVEQHTSSFFFLPSGDKPTLSPRLLLLLQRLARGLVPLPCSLQAGPPTEARSAAPAGQVRQANKA
jgi:hypothetical protein